ncbi:short-chain dehydrogenase [Mycena rosella]|uniref:Short-chain dehydrogenase n=1 Tax=Mycena rosella TaxID=1033263 RepID=A0AAD7D1L9_MYCRO|nr:short-chain dehydrogenase [Mycena rosella]
MRFTMRDFIKSQLAKPAPVVTADLTGKTVVVLGANTGLGFEATKHFAKMNPGRLILACRSETRGQAALDRLKAGTGYKKAELWIVDLANFASVKQFADKFERDGGRLDILVENAAILPFKYESTKDGWESALQVNCLATPLLAILLIPIMTRTARDHATLPRIVIVASTMHYFLKLEKSVYENSAMLKTVGSKKYCTSTAMQTRYELTKLLNVFFARALNAHLGPSTPLVVNAVCPGYCYSELRRDYSGLRAVEQGSRQLVWGAVAQGAQPEDLRGTSDFVISPEGAKLQERVWEEMVQILGEVDPRVTTTVKKYLSAEV